jgi:DNA-binding NarL/FixJ family response regulator
MSNNTMTNQAVKKVLMIEDDDMMRILFKDTFWIHASGDSKIDITTVTSLQEGRDYLADPQNPRPKVFFLDLGLMTATPEGTKVREFEPTLSFIEELRKTEEFSKVPIIVYSGYNEDDIKDKAKASGADHYLVKGDLSPSEIVKFVQKL